MRIKSMIVDYLKNNDGKEVNIYNLALNEALELPKSYRSTGSGVIIEPVKYPNKKFKKWIEEAETLDFETNVYDYYQIIEYGKSNDRITWNLRVPKEIS